MTYCVFSLAPQVLTIYNSFFENYREGLTQVGPKFVGFQNYVKLFTPDKNGTVSILKFAGNTMINLNRPGYYMVHFNADAVETGAAGNVKIQMQNNGANVSGAEATAYSGTETDIVNLGFSAIVRVQPNCCAVSSNVPASLTFVNSGVAAVVSNAAVVVTKIA